MGTAATPLWQPSQAQIDTSNLAVFMAALRKDGVNCRGYPSLWQWSVDHISLFWTALWRFCGVTGEMGEPVLVNGDQMPGAQFFPNGRLNFSENLLRRTDERDAILYWSEDKIRRRLSARQFRELVIRLAKAMRGMGIMPGDRVAGFVPNSPEAVAGALAAAAIGAIWSSCSPDFGPQGVIDRFGQITPKLLLSADGYYYNGKRHSSIEKLLAVVPQIPSLQHIIVFQNGDGHESITSLPKAQFLEDVLAPFDAEAFVFERFPFNHPLYIMYSSGTTGVPKCILHGAGGTLLQHLKEHRLHSNIQPGDPMFYYSTCGWMMWNWLVTGLASDAVLMLYDGSPFYPNEHILFDFAEESGCRFFGTSAKYIDACAKAGVEPKRSHDLSALRVLASTGSPLSAEGFDYVYAKIKSDLCLASISGGTDILSCFMLGNPIAPVWRGEIQTRGLAMAVEVWDEKGKPVQGRKGELVCVKPFPSMPLGFWNDPGGNKYRAAYFEHYPNVWRHGDYVELTARNGIIVYGRSDAVLNPGGVRIGTAEIYRQVEQLPEILESVVIGQDFDGDVRVVLFVRLADGHRLDDSLIERIKKQIRTNTTPRHVPAKIVAVPDIPRTRSGKIAELAVREVVAGRPINNQEALANPDSLRYFKALPALAE